MPRPVLSALELLALVARGIEHELKDREKHQAHAAADELVRRVLAAESRIIDGESRFHGES